MKWVYRIRLEFSPPLRDDPGNYFRFSNLEENFSTLDWRAENRREISFNHLFTWSQTTVEWSDPNDGLKILYEFIKFVKDLPEGSKNPIKNVTDILDELEGLKALLERAINEGAKFKLTKEEIREKEALDYVGAFIGKIVYFIIGIGILLLAFDLLSKYPK